MELLDDDGRKEIASADFREALEKIDFEKAYDPFSKEYQTALNLGIMALLLGNLYLLKKKQDAKEEESIGTVVADAKRDLQKFIDTGDMSFKKASDEGLSRAEGMIRKAYARLPSGDEKALLKAIESEIAQLRKQG